MLCFLEGKIIPAITLLDEHLCFHFKKIKGAVSGVCGELQELHGAGNTESTKEVEGSSQP